MERLPTWLLWIIVVGGAVLSPFIAMLLLFLAAELLWDVADAIGGPAVLSLGIGILAGLAIGKLRPQQPQPSPT